MSDTLSEKHEDSQIEDAEIRESGTDEASFFAREKKLLRKIDWHLLPFLSLLYLLSFLDRVNIGQARLNNLERDLNMKSGEYSIALLTFFIGYVIFEAASGLLLKYFRPSRFIPAIILVWGSICIGMGFVTNFVQLAVLRAFLGLAESALFPAICICLTFWYKRREQNIRISLFFSAVTLSGAFGGLLAFAIGKMEGLGGLGGWAWIFIIEGIMTVVAGFFSFRYVYDFPAEAKFLTTEEKAMVASRLRSDQGATGEVDFHISHLKSAILDWKTWIFCLMYIGVAEPLYSLALFTPTIIASLGSFTRPQAQLLSAPPFALAFVVTIFSALYSDRIGNRGKLNIFWMSLACVGFIILCVINPVEQPAVAYFALVLCVCTVCPGIPNTITWCGNNLGPSYKRVLSMGFVFMTGNSGGIVASLVYFPSDAPRFQRGHGTALGFSALAVATSIVMSVYMTKENARREALYGSADSAMMREGGEKSIAEFDAQQVVWGLDKKSELDIGALGDHHPGFRYIP